ncbi:MAG: adenylyltransferase/cytidyltransferase family protein [Phycisphaerae bacterium]|nr:adenylyltransferase/cytidyltransferase family protein [Phycisphaerae bacterium]
MQDDTNKESAALSEQRPVTDLVFGSAGFIVLDILEPTRGGAPVYLHCGGTAGNVAVILGALGWDSYPFGRFPQDDRGWEILANDAQRFGVHIDFMHLTPPAPFPMLVQRKRSDGSDRPVFTFRCPRCSCRWRGWSSLTNASATDILDRLPRFGIFLIDRCTPGNMTLALQAKADGALIVFEPSSLSRRTPPEAARFRKALELADIVKYADDRVGDLGDDDFPRAPLLEIHTKGNEGLRYRRRLCPTTMSPWTTLDAPDVAGVRDTCGAGDWLTAVLLNHIGRRDQSTPDGLADGELQEILSVAQAASAWACLHAGARGGMYGDPHSLEDYITEKTGKRYPLTFRGAPGSPESRDTTLEEAMLEFCPLCRGDRMKPAIVPSEGDSGEWQQIGRPGYVGKNAAARQEELTRRYGPGNWRIVYEWQNSIITRDEALQLYVDAYIAHFAARRDVLDWLVETASDVYDISPADVDSGTDFSIQNESATHLQDIAVRIAVKHFDRDFEGKDLLQIRGKKSAGSCLSPGVVSFHKPGDIVTPEVRGWWRNGTIESFWQSNKYLQARRWNSRIFVFGGSFNPIHCGHLDLARFARDSWGFDRVIFVPNGDNYRKKTLAGVSAQIRLEMVQAAIEGEASMEVLDVEVYDKIPMRTAITMRELSERYSDSQLVLYRGLDALHRTHRDCFALPNLFVLVLDRKGFNRTLEQVVARHRRLEPVMERIIYLGDAFADDLSSTQVRDAMGRGNPIAGMVPRAVEELIRKHGLYVRGPANEK